MPTFSSPSYPRPPITEAVIGFQFGLNLDGPALQEVSAKFAANYPRESPLTKVNVGLGQPDAAGNTQMAFNTEIGRRRSAADEQEIFVVMRTGFAVSQLAPYPGWAVFFQRWMRDWRIWKNSIGYKPIEEINIRYINRIDIPRAPIIEERDYVNVWIQTPDLLGPSLQYAAQVSFALEEIKSNSTVVTAVVPSPIPECISLILDIGLNRNVEIPQRDQEIFLLLDKMRVQKNLIFESCITDKARSLFE